MSFEVDERFRRDLLHPGEVLADFRYKPNFRFSAEWLGRRWLIVVEMWVEDSRAPFNPWELNANWTIQKKDDFTHNAPKRIVLSPNRQLTPVTSRNSMPDFEKGDEQMFIAWLVRVLWSMEQHEIDEWVRYKGELVNDPHKER